MGIAELILVAIGLAMDAFAVSICKGLNMRRINYRHGVIIALFFGGFQALMPLIGWLLGTRFEKYIVSFDHWVAFALLAFIGGKMIFEAFKKEGAESGICDTDTLRIRELLVLAIATSIDALAVGITLALLPDTNIWLSVLLIGVITFALSLFGVVMGNRFGSKFKSKAEVAGGVILVLIGLKILLEHMGVIAF